MDVALNTGDPVKAARQPTNGHPNYTRTDAARRIMSTTAFQFSLNFVSVSVNFFYRLFMVVFQKAV